MPSDINLPQIRGKYRFNAPLGELTWFQVGGLAKVVFRPEDINDLAFFLANKPKYLKIAVIGVGSNIIIKDSGFDGVIIKLGRQFNFINQLDTCTLQIGCGTMDINVAKFAAQAEIAGLEFLSGIPGTIGGAIAMNAGAYGKCINDVLVSARGVNINSGKIIDIHQKEMNLAYRCNPYASSVIFTEVILRGERGDYQKIMRNIDDIQTKRNNSQPVRSKTGGSTFRNPPGYSAWQLIDAAGCRGLKVGGAMVSDLHTNFLINTGNATAEDLITLINLIKERVYNHTGIMLEEEIKIIYS
jgi:UDP-N-acetylmuramate dehydrogenase